jgi:hypothetical protein
MQKRYFIFFIFFAACQSKTEPVFDSRYEQRYKYGSILGGDGLTFSATPNTKNPSLKINRYLWHSALDRLKNIPLMSSDGTGGVIVTDWYQPSHHERFKIVISIFGSELRANAFEVKIHKQVYKNNFWQNEEADLFMATKLEDAILRQARLFQLYEQNS